MGDDKVQRKLAAILAADVVGYSRLMHVDDQATLRLLNQGRALFAETANSCGGRIVNAPGDSVLAEFPSIVQAVTCAVEIQRLIAARNLPLPEAQRMCYRIGVNLGDVLVDDDGIYGDGVNVAARLENLCCLTVLCEQLQRNSAKPVMDTVIWLRPTMNADEPP